MAKNDKIKKVAIAAATISTALALTKKISDEKSEPRLLAPNRDEFTKVYLVGGGIGNLSLAYALINHANLSAENITIYKNKFNEFLPINDEYNYPNYKTFDDRYNISNFANTYEMLKDILSEEDLDILNKKINTPENIQVIDLNSHTFDDVNVVSESTKLKLKKLVLKPKSFDKDETIERYFYYTDFVDSSLYYFLATLFNLRRTSLVSELKEAIITMSSSHEFFDIRTAYFHKQFEHSLKHKGVNFVEDYKFVKLNIKDNSVTKIIFENNNQIIEQYVDKKDIVSLESPSYVDKISLGTLNSIPQIVHESTILKDKNSHYIGQISGEAPENSIIFVKFTFTNDSFSRKIREMYSNKNTFILKLKSGISVKLRGEDVIVKILNPEKSSIFVGNNFNALNGEDFFFELVKTFNLDDDYGHLRMSLKSVFITLLPDYRDGIETNSELMPKDVSNLCYISSRNSKFGTNYSIEKLVKQGLIIAHEMMGIDHIEIMEENVDKLKIVKFLDEVLIVK
ncbi:hypothetical protein ABID14_000543 [Peptoniphilus olsenii]|uniref:Uncharacterized protein n=1 Tax=Peptoniphilus olsenii TaxID=411570 RepID=A0ABV2J813_9FIRM